MTPPKFPGLCPPTRQMKLRAVIGMGVLFAALLLLVCRLAQIQIVDHNLYKKLAFQQQIIRRACSIWRGNIYDSSGRTLAISVQRPSIFADPSDIERPEATASLLSRVLHLEKKTLLGKLTKPCQFVWVKRQVAGTDAERVRRMSLKGVHLRNEYRRTYPQSRMATHVVGFTDIDGKGLAGIELELDLLLTGTPGREMLMCDASRHIIRQAGDRPLQPAADGYEVYLTIDSYVQNIVQEELTTAVKKHAPESAWVVVLEAQTGAVLAMANWPDFDPNTPAAFKEANRRNRAITDIYEFGSTMKPFVVAAALEEGLITPDKEFFCHNGEWHVGRRTVHDVHPYGTLTVSDIIAKSSNIGAAQIGMLLGAERFHRRLRGFGFDEPTGIHLPGEVSGLLRPLRSWNRHSLISISFGQELAVTPLSVACAFNVFPSGGVLLRPQIVKKITESGTGQVVYEMRGPSVVRRVISEQTAGLVMQMLRGVVDEGTGTAAKLKEYSVAGKTGTAQLIRADGRGYRSNAYLATFVGIAPAEAPRLTVLVSLKAPSKNGYYGGGVAAPACGRIIQRTLRYMQVPERPQQTTIAKAH